MHELTAQISRADKEPKTITMEFPSCFEDFSRKHLLVLTEWLHTAKKDPTAFPKFIVQFIGIPKKVWKQLSAEQLFYCEVNDEGEVEMMPELAYLSQRYENLNSLIKRVGILIGPDDRLKNISLEQIAFADHFSQAFAEDPSEKNLNHFFAALYRPFFLPYHKDLLPLFQQIARLVPRRTKEAALINYRGMTLASRQIYLTVFKSRKGKPSKIERLGWNGTIRKLAKTGIHGTEAQCRRLKYPDAMLTFDFNNIESEEQEERLENIKKK